MAVRTRKAERKLARDMSFESDGAHLSLSTRTLYGENEVLLIW